MNNNELLNNKIHLLISKFDILSKSQNFYINRFYTNKDLVCNFIDENIKISNYELPEIQSQNTAKLYLRPIEKNNKYTY